jgi:hypothetical protein
MGTKREFGGSPQFKTEVRRHLHMTPLTGLATDRHDSDAATMGKDPLIFIEDERPDARSQGDSLFSCCAEHGLCGGNPIEEHGSRASSFLFLQQSRFVSALECGGLLGELRLHGVEFFLHRRLTRFQQRPLSVEVFIRLSSGAAATLSTLVLSELGFDLIKLCGERVLRLRSRREAIAPGLPLLSSHERLLFDSSKRRAQAVEGLHRLSDALVAGLERQQAGQGVSH